MSDSVQPQRWQPTRLPHPWDSPGKNTGVGCHFLLQCMKVISESEVTQSCLTLSDPMDYSLPGSSIHGIFNARVLEWVPIAFSDASMLLFPFISPSSSSPLPLSINLFSMSASPLLLCKQICQYRLTRFNIFASIYNICFSLSDLLYSVSVSRSSMSMK